MSTANEQYALDEPPKLTQDTLIEEGVQPASFQFRSLPELEDSQPHGWNVHHARPRYSMFFHVFFYIFLELFYEIAREKDRKK